MTWRVTPILITGLAFIAWMVYMIFNGLSLSEGKTFGIVLVGAGIPVIVTALVLLLEQAMVDHAKPTWRRLLLIEGTILLVFSGIIFYLAELMAPLAGIS